MFGSGYCGKMGNLGCCQGKPEQNVQNIEKLGRYAITMGQSTQLLANATDAKYFRVCKDLETLHGIQRQIIESQNEKWIAIEKQFNVFQQIVHEMRN